MTAIERDGEGDEQVVTRPALVVTATPGGSREYARPMRRIGLTMTVLAAAALGAAMPAGASANSDGLYVQELDRPDAPATRINTGEFAKAATEGIAWAPNSRLLAFLCEAASSQSQVCVAGTDGQSISKLTSVAGDLAAPAWSPDGKKLAFLLTENAPRKAGPLEAMTPETGVIEAKIYEQRLTVLDAETGDLQQISPPDMYVYEFDWSPDGKQFALIASPGEGDANWYTAQLYRLAVTGGALAPVYKPPLQIAVPRWSPDGKSIAFIAGIMSDEGSIGGDVFVISATGGVARNLTPAIPASPSWLAWQSAEKILLAGRIDGDTGIGSVELGSGEITQIWRGPESILKDESISVGAPEQIHLGWPLERPDNVGGVGERRIISGMCPLSLILDA